MEERGVVVESARGTARVRIQRSSRCGQCPGCIVADDGVSMIARAIDRIGVSPGDVVRIETTAPSPLSAALLLFLLPLASLFAGYGAGAAVAAALGLSKNASIVGAAGAVLFFLASFGVLSLVRGKRVSGAAGSVIVEKLASGSAGAAPDGVPPGSSGIS